jgi:hypothetical protein
MNRRQKIGIWVGVIIIVLLLLFPPRFASDKVIGLYPFWRTGSVYYMNGSSFGKISLDQIEWGKQLTIICVVLLIDIAWVLTNGSKKDKPG